MNKLCISFAVEYIANRLIKYSSIFVSCISLHDIFSFPFNRIIGPVLSQFENRLSPKPVLYDVGSVA